MSEPSYHPSGKDPCPPLRSPSMTSTGLPHEGQLGEGVTADGPGRDSRLHPSRRRDTG